MRSAREIIEADGRRHAGGDSPVFAGTMPRFTGSLGVDSMSGAETNESEMPSLKQSPSHLLLVAFPGAHLDPIRQALSQAGVTINAMPGKAGSNGQHLPSAEGDEPVVIAAREDGDQATLEAILDEQPSVHCLCVTEGPIAHVARSLKAGSRLDEAAAAWQRDAEAALNLIRQHPFQCLTVLHEQVMTEPAAFARLLKEKCSLDITLNLSPVKLGAEEALFRVLAAQHINQEVVLSDIALELEASAWPIVEPDTAAGLDSAAAVEAYRGGSRQLEEFRQQFQEFETLRDEREQLLAQLHKVQLELEDYFLRSQQLEKERDKLQNDLEKKQKTIENMQRGIDGRTNTIRERAQTIRELEAHIKSIYKSSSWRLTKPVRAIGRVFRRLFRRR